MAADTLQCITGHSTLRAIALFIVIGIILASTILSLNRKLEAPGSRVIILAFDRSILRGLQNNRDTSVFVLDGSFLNHVYNADKLVIITHAARYGGLLLFALNKKPDIQTRYGIIINGKIYEALRASEFAKHIRARTILLISCNLDRDTIEKVFRGRTLSLYYTISRATDQQAIHLIRMFLNNKSLEGVPGIGVVKYG